MKVAIIGVGRMGRLHATILASLPEVDEVLVSDADPDMARVVASEIGGRMCEDPDDAIAGADAVAIASTTPTHASLIEKAVAAGRPVFVEKPLAFTLDESIAVVELVERTGAILQLGFQRRYDVAYREARRRVETGDLGKVYLVRLIAHDNAPPPEAYIASSGGLFRDSSVHDFDAIRYVTGSEVERVVAVGAVRISEVFSKHDDVDTAGAILTMADGTLGILSQTRHNPLGYDIRMEVVGARDAVSVGVGPRMPSQSLEPGAEVVTDGWDGFLTRFAEAYRAELEAFLDVARGRAAPACTARDGVEAMRVAIAATLSAREGRAVDLSEIPGGAAGT